MRNLYLTSQLLQLEPLSLVLNRMDAAERKGYIGTGRNGLLGQRLRSGGGCDRPGA